MIGIILLCLVFTILAVLLYYNKAFPEAIEIANEMEEDKYGYYFKTTEKIGFIIFPGVKADERSYAYLAGLLYQEGYNVAIPKVRFHINASAEQGIEIMDSNPHIEQWYLIGHSAGGMTVSRIAEIEPERFEGFVLLASYILSDLSKLDMKALRISASNDGIMNQERMQSNLEFLPTDATNIVLEGANHQGFGAYDSIGKDGEASMTWKEQQEKTVDLILVHLMNQRSKQ